MIRNDGRWPEVRALMARYPDAPCREIGERMKPPLSQAGAGYYMTAIRKEGPLSVDRSDRLPAVPDPEPPRAVPDVLKAVLGMSGGTVNGAQLAGLLLPAYGPAGPLRTAKGLPVYHDRDGVIHAVKKIK